MDMDRALRTDFYYWRLFATGFCFVAFGVGGIVLGILVTPLLPLFFRDRDHRERAVRRLIYLTFRVFVGLMKSVGVLTYEFHGREKLRAPGQLVIANHPTLIDVVFLIAAVPNGVCIVKQDLLHSRFVGGLLRRAGYIGNTAEPEASLEACVEALRRGATVVLFPEGSRSVPGTSQRFRRGAAYVALAAQKDLSPVYIACSTPTLTKSERWHDIPNRRIHFAIRVGDKIPFVTPNTTSKRSTAQAITDRAKRYFLQEAPGV